MHCHRYVASIKIYPLCHGESLTTKCEWLYVYLDWFGLLVGNKSAVKTVGNIVSTYYAVKCYYPILIQDMQYFQFYKINLPVFGLYMWFVNTRSICIRYICILCKQDC